MSWKGECRVFSGPRVTQRIQYELVLHFWYVRILELGEKNERINHQPKKSEKWEGKGKNPADKSAKCEMVDLNSKVSVITVKNEQDKSFG